MNKEKKEKVIKFVHKWLLHLEALFLIALILFGYFFLYQDRAIKEEISINCGWEGEDYECFCEKDKALEIKNKMENPTFTGLNLSNVEVVE